MSLKTFNVNFYNHPTIQMTLKLSFGSKKRV